MQISKLFKIYINIILNHHPAISTCSKNWIERSFSLKLIENHATRATRHLRVLHDFIALIKTFAPTR